MPAACASWSAGFEGVGIVRVEDDRVDALRDQVADVLELAGRVRRCRWIDGELGDLARHERLRLGGADLLLAEAVADADRVRVADLVRLGRALTGAMPAPTAAVLGAAVGAVGGALDAPELVQADATTATAARPPSNLVRVDPLIIRSPPLTCDAPIWSRRRTDWPRRGEPIDSISFVAPPARAAPGHHPSAAMARAMRRACSR